MCTDVDFSFWSVSFLIVDPFFWCVYEVYYCVVFFLSYIFSSTNFCILYVVYTTLARHSDNRTIFIYFVN